MRCWCGCLSGVRCRLFAYGPADATAVPKPHQTPQFKSSLVSLSGTSLPSLVTKRPLNGCSSGVCSLTYACDDVTSVDVLQNYMSQYYHKFVKKKAKVPLVFNFYCNYWYTTFDSWAATLVRDDTAGCTVPNVMTLILDMV